MSPQLERLEDRCLLAASINLSGNGTLSINGDDGDNNVAVEQAGGTIYVGVDVNGDGYFDDPEDLLDDFAAGDVTSLKINTKGGDDLVYVKFVDVTGDRKINLGSGDDAISILGGEGRDLKLNTGSGDDCAILRTETLRNAKVSLGGDDDVMEFIQSTVGGKASLNAGGGADFVNVQVDTFNGSVKVDLGGGPDFFRIDLNTTNFTGDDLKLNGGGDRDILLGGGAAEAAIEGAGGSVKNFEEDLLQGDLAGDDLTRFNAAQTKVGDCDTELEALITEFETTLP